MGSLAHLMQETSADGIFLHDYIHEGIGQIWADSLSIRARHAGWVLIEEQSEGGDVLAERRRERPDFLAGFNRVSARVAASRSTAAADETNLRSDPNAEPEAVTRSESARRGRAAEARPQIPLEAHVEGGRRAPSTEIQLVAGEVQSGSRSALPPCQRTSPPTLK